MSKFTDFIDGIVDEGKVLAKAELKKLVADAKKDKSDFVRLQAENLERWTVMLAEGDLTTKGYKKLVQKMEVMTQLEVIKLKVSAKASAQRLADGIQQLVVDSLFALI
jgi:precorrin-6B methylase 1